MSGAKEHEDFWIKMEDKARQLNIDGFCNPLVGR